MDKPSQADYIGWLRRELGVDLTSRVETHYASVTARAKLELEATEFWATLSSRLAEFRDEYLIATGYPLFAATPALIIHVKPHVSFVDKTYRRNVLDNTSWPEPPEGGWITPPGWHSQINDILRAEIVVKYLDGPRFLTDRLIESAQAAGWPASVEFQARDEGYYAAHVYLQRQFEVPRMDWDSERISISVEIQVTTQLQELIRTLTHFYYAQRRSVPHSGRV